MPGSNTNKGDGGGLNRVGRGCKFGGVRMDSTSPRRSGGHFYDDIKCW